MSELCPRHGTKIVRPDHAEPFCAFCGYGSPIAGDHHESAVRAESPDADFDFYPWPPHKIGGQHAGPRTFGVLVVHRETGIAVAVADGRSQMRSRADAVEKLRALLKLRCEAWGCP